jgi:hypothetical protein
MVFKGSSALPVQFRATSGCYQLNSEELNTKYPPKEKDLPPPTSSVLVRVVLQLSNSAGIVLWGGTYRLFLGGKLEQLFDEPVLTRTSLPLTQRSCRFRIMFIASYP